MSLQPTVEDCGSIQMNAFCVAENVPWDETGKVFAASLANVSDRRTNHNANRETILRPTEFLLSAVWFRFDDHPPPPTPPHCLGSR